MELIHFFFSFLWMCVCIRIANNNNRNSIVAGILGFLFGLFAILFYWAIGKNKNNDKIIV